MMYVAIVVIRNLTYLT